MAADRKNFTNPRRTANFDLKRLLYLMANSSVLSAKTPNRFSWQRSLCYSDKKFESFPRETLLLYRRMVVVFESHWIRIRSLIVHQDMGRNISFMIPTLSSASKPKAEDSTAPITMYICCGGKDMVALDWLPFVAKFFQSNPEETNTAFLLVEYPGYGFNTGIPTPQSCTDIVLQTLKKGLDRYKNREVTVRFLGYSLGAAILLSSAKAIFNYIYTNNKSRYSTDNKSMSFTWGEFANKRAKQPNETRYLSRLCRVKARKPAGAIKVKSSLSPFKSRCKPQRSTSSKRGVLVRIRIRLLNRKKRTLPKLNKKLNSKSLDSALIEQWLKKVKLTHLILIAPFTSTAECVSAYLKVPFPLRSLTAHLVSVFQNNTTRFNNINVIKHLFKRLSKNKDKFKLLVFHGDMDKMVPCYMGQQIINEASLYPNVHKCTNEECPQSLLHAKMCVIPGADHINICSNANHLNHIFKAMH